MKNFGSLALSLLAISFLGCTKANFSGNDFSNAQYRLENFDGDGRSLNACDGGLGGGNGEGMNQEDGGNTGGPDNPEDGDIVTNKDIPNLDLDWYKIEVNMIDGDSLNGVDAKMDDETIVINASTRIIFIPTPTEDTWSVVDSNGIDDGVVKIKVTTWNVDGQTKALWGFNRHDSNQTVFAKNVTNGQEIDVTQYFTKVSISDCSGFLGKANLWDDSLKGILWDYDKGAKQFRMYMGEIDE